MRLSATEHSLFCPEARYACKRRSKRDSRNVMERQARFHVDPQAAAVFLSISNRTGESIRDEVSAIHASATFA